MADLTFSLWLDEPPRARSRLGFAPSAATPKMVEIELLDAERKPVAAPVEVPLPKPLDVEVPSGDAGFGWARVTPPLSVKVGAAEGAEMVRARAGGRVLGFAPLAVAAPKPTLPAARRVFNPDGNWKLVLVSERFGDADAFFAAAAQLHAFIMAMPPFSEAAVGRRLQLEALFWPSGPDGLFNTKVDGRRVFGDHDRVRKFVKKSGAKGKLVIVLVKSHVRGGAGGTGKRPAWVTIASDANERWEGVALHELGHSFGLADEYDDSAQPVPEPKKLEPNVTDKRDATKAPWATLRTPGLAHNPTCDADGNPAVPPGTVGTFEGARYKRTGRYRPTAECLMRRTDRTFCPVCQAAIRRVLGAAP